MDEFKAGRRSGDADRTLRTADVCFHRVLNEGSTALALMLLALAAGVALRARPQKRRKPAADSSSGSRPNRLHRWRI